MDLEVLKKTVSDLLASLGAEVSAVGVNTGPRRVVAVTSPDSAALIGPRGEHLRALNTVARRIIEARHGEEASNFLIDVNGYQEAQLEAVRQNARVLAQRARLFKHDVEMPPQSAYERLVIHELFAEDPDIKTESAGEGKFRHVVLKYRSGGGVTGSI